MKKNIFSRLFSKIDFDKIFLNVFSPHSRRRIHQGLLLAFLILPTYLLGRMLAFSLRPALTKINSSLLPTSSSEDLPALSEHMQAIQASGLFGDRPFTLGADCKQNPKAAGCTSRHSLRAERDCENATKRSSLPITLLATIVLQDEVKSVASVQVRGKRDTLNLRKGEEISHMARVTKVRARKLIIKNKKTGLCEFIPSQLKKQVARSQIKVERDPVKGQNLLESSLETGIAVHGDNKFKIKKSLRDEVLGNIDEMLMQARAIPIKNPDGTLAFRMQEIVPGSTYTKLNIKDGDIITEINGKKFTNINEVMSLFGEIRERDHYKIKLFRNGAERTLEYDFE